MQELYLLRGNTDQFFDSHYQLAVFGHKEDEYPFAVSLLLSCTVCMTSHASNTAVVTAILCSSAFANICMLVYAPCILSM